MGLPTQQIQAGNGPKGLTPGQRDKEVEYVAFGSKNLVRLTVNMVRDTLCKPSRSGHLPNDADCMKFIKRCQSQQLDPWLDECYLVGYDRKHGPAGADFTMIIGYSVYLKRAELNPDFDGYQSGVIVMMINEFIEREGDLVLKNETLIGGWCKVFRKNLKIPILKRANLATNMKGTDFWARDPGAMIVKVAEADAFRAAFPSTIGHMYMEAELAAGTFGQQEERVAAPSFQTDSRVLAERTRTSLANEYGLSEGGETKLVEPAKEAPKEPAKKSHKKKVVPAPAPVVEAPTTEEPPEQPELAPEPEFQEPPQGDTYEPDGPAAMQQLDPNSPHGMLAAKLEQGGFTFEHLVGWATWSGNYPNADSHGTLAEVPDSIVQRWLKAWTGLKLALDSYKGRGS